MSLVGNCAWRWMLWLSNGNNDIFTPPCSDRSGKPMGRPDDLHVPMKSLLVLQRWVNREVEDRHSLSNGPTRTSTGQGRRRKKMRESAEACCIAPLALARMGRLDRER